MAKAKINKVNVQALISLFDKTPFSETLEFELSENSIRSATTTSGNEATKVWSVKDAKGDKLWASNNEFETTQVSVSKGKHLRDILHYFDTQGDGDVSISITVAPSGVKVINVSDKRFSINIICASDSMSDFTMFDEDILSEITRYKEQELIAEFTFKKGIKATFKKVLSLNIDENKNTYVDIFTDEELNLCVRDGDISDIKLYPTETPIQEGDVKITKNLLDVLCNEEYKVYVVKDFQINVREEEEYYTKAVFVSQNSDSVVSMILADDIVRDTDEAVEDMTAGTGWDTFLDD